LLPGWFLTTSPQGGNMAANDSSVIHQGDALEVLRTLPAESVQMCCTSPPYWGLRDYGVTGQLGLERTPREYVAGMVAVFEEVRRVLKPDGVLWLNLGDSYANDTKWGGASGGKHAADLHGATGIGRGKTSTGLKPKDLIGIPWRVAFALQEAGWYLRCDVIWSKPNPMPESVTDRPTKAHEYIFLLSKSERYYYNADAIKEHGVGDHPRNVQGPMPTRVPGASDHSGMRKSGDKQRGHGRRHAGFNDRWDAMSKAEQTGVMRNKRSVWNIATRSFAEAHFATFPEEIPTVCILAGSRPGDVVIDPFNGAGTVGVVCAKTGREYIGIELNPAYVAMAEKRIYGVAPLFNQV